jgi:hypothetical protein
MRTGTRLRWIAVCATLALAAPTSLATSSLAAPQVAADPAVIAKWDGIAMRTVLPLGPPAQLYLGIVSAAMYNAVITIEGRYELYTEQPRAHANSSPEAAAATAAYRVLTTYFPDSAGPLAADYAASLASIRAGAAKVHGIRVGEAAAAAILKLRENDGRNDPSILPLVPGDEPGEWRGTPPNPVDAPMVAPWLGFVTPLLLDSPTQFQPPGPDALDSQAYADDFAEELADGRSDSVTRTPEETRTAWFFSDNVIRQYQEARALLAADQGLDIADTARMYAILNMATADAQIACWRAKYDFAFWRPVTAIQTTVDPTWTPMITTPMYPDYTSGHACLTGSMANGLTYLFPSGFDLQMSSTVIGASPNVPPTTPTIRHYTSAATLNAETMNARIWLGIHFRKAMIDGNQLGHDVSAWVVEHYFQPVE